MSERVPSLVLLFGLGAGCGSTALEPLSAAACDACGGDCVEERLPVDDRDHRTGPIDYAFQPPAGGPHDPCWAPWGVHDDPVAPENWVHNLEHGGIVFLYRCPDGCADDVAALADLVELLEPGSALLTPYDAMDARFAAVAWRHRALLGCADEETFLDFYETHLDHAPESTRSEPAPECM